jgi:hypothetical protein
MKSVTKYSAVVLALLLGVASLKTIELPAVLASKSQSRQQTQAALRTRMTRMAGGGKQN